MKSALSANKSIIIMIMFMGRGVCNNRGVEMDLGKRMKLQQSESQRLASTQLEGSPMVEAINYKRSLSFSQKVAAMVTGPERLWSTALLASTAALLAIVGGYAIAYPSSSLINLKNMNNGRSIENGSILENLYGVSSTIILLQAWTLLTSNH